jgi:alanine racemase
VSFSVAFSSIFLSEMNRAWIEVDLGALTRNAQALSDRAGVPLIPMVKADAYGLGAVQVAHALEPMSPHAFGVATVAEGEELRKAGITRRIIVFTPLSTGDYESAHASRLIPSLGSREEIAAWKLYGSPYNLQIDTGMARAGVPWREIAGLAEVLKAIPPEAVFTHFHSSELDDGSMEIQEGRFKVALDGLPAKPQYIHTDNSAAIVRHGKSKLSAIRPGIFLYGVGSGEGAALQPEPVVSMKARIVETRWVEQGDTVSYDATWTAGRRSLIATIPIGYADGYPRNASSVGLGVVNGDKLVPIVGRVTMDMIMLDITDSGARPGDVVTMIGDPRASNAAIDIASIATLASMSPYELLTGLRNRIPRIYHR